MIYNEPRHQEETLLSAEETKVRFEAKIIDADYLLEPNAFKEYKVTLMPLTTDENQRFFEVAEKALMLVEMRKPYYSRKQAQPQYEDKHGWIVSSSLFPPKLNIVEQHTDYLPYRDVTATGHLRDLDNGNVVFNLDYLDFYEEDARTAFQIEEEENPDAPFDIDF